jgi:hypothetical protein
MNKVGRPVKYTDENERIEIRRIQNKENQRRCRKKKKLFDELSSFSSNQNNRNTEYKTNLVNYFKQFDFDYFFTGTIDLNYQERQKLEEENQEIKLLNQTLETNLSFQTERRIGIKSLRKYTEKYIQYLSDKQLIERCFVVFEVGKNGKYHIHIMFCSNPNIIDFDKTSENRWLIGNSITISIPTQNDKEKLLDYCVKELNPSSNKVDDLNKIDNWFISGDFNTKNKQVRTTLSSITT